MCIVLSSMSHHLSAHPDPLVSPGTGPAPRSSGSSSGGSTEDIPSAVPPKDLSGSVRQHIFLDYSTYMARFVLAQAGGSPERSPSHSTLGSPTPTKVSDKFGDKSSTGVGHEHKVEADRPCVQSFPVLWLVSSLLAPWFEQLSGGAESTQRWVPPQPGGWWLLSPRSSVRTGAERRAWPG